MEENNQTGNFEAPKNIEQKPIKGKTKPKGIIIWALACLLLIVAGAGAYIWRDMDAKKDADSNKEAVASLEKKISDLEKQISDSQKTSTTDTEKTVCKEPTASAKENIIASITSKNTAALEGYMATSVRVVLAASEAAFDRTPTKAISDIEYVVNAEEPWNFSLSTATLDTYKAGFYKDYFKANSIVGVAKDKKVVVFNFDCNGKINAVFMASSSDLLTE